MGTEAVNVDLRGHSLTYRHSVDSVCLADLCDIFECKDYPEQTIKVTVFNQRDFYSGKPQTRVSTPEPETKGRKNKTKKVYQEYENEEKEQVSEGYETTYIYNPKTLSAYHKSQMLQR